LPKKLDLGSGHRLQYAALPFRVGERLEVMLVSSRETKRWVLPKGWPMKGRKPHAAAAQEALEEAGLEGKVGKVALGTYSYQKRMQNGAVLPCLVHVFPLQVSRQLKVWPEMGERTTRWFSVHEAAAAVNEAELRELISTFEQTLAAKLAAASAKRPA
jgi:8-oxo-dGTP pyrophosphatase MutT (NUDIX family)